MIILKGIICRYFETVQVELPSPNMVMDPRVNNIRNCRFRCVYHKNGTTVTLTRIADQDDDEWYSSNHGPFEFRVYDPSIEVVPDFNNLTIYNYRGVDGEIAPYETIELLIDDPSVKIIRGAAFMNCKRIKKCSMHDGVHTIEDHAFAHCEAMKMIRLSRNLKRIGFWAFFECASLEALFLPSSIDEIENEAFFGCSNIRIFSLPPCIHASQLGEKIIQLCDTFFDITQIQPYVFQPHVHSFDSVKVNRSIIAFYRNLSPLYQTCLSTNVTPQTIHDCIETHGRTIASTTDHDGMTPLHVLAMNPHANSGTIGACFGANLVAAFIRDRRGKNPLDYLREYDNLEGHTSLVVSLCIHREKHKNKRMMKKWRKKIESEGGNFGNEKLEVAKSVQTSIAEKDEQEFDPQDLLAAFAVFVALTSIYFVIIL